LQEGLLEAEMLAIWESYLSRIDAQ